MKLNIEKNDLLQWIRYTAGLAICGFVIYCLTKTKLGLAPWEILSKGISMHCPLSFGQVIIAVSVAVFIIDLLMKEVIGVGMILDTILVGVFVDLFTWLDLMPAFNGYIVKICVYIAGLVFMGLAQYLCMSSGQGLGPRDTLIVGAGKRLRGIPIGAVQMGILVMVFLGGWMLGGPVGPGTVLSVALLGPALQLWCGIFHFEPRDISNKSLLDYIRIDKNDHLC